MAACSLSRIHKVQEWILWAGNAHGYSAFWVSWNLSLVWCRIRSSACFVLLSACYICRSQIDRAQPGLSPQQSFYAHGIWWELSCEVWWASSWNCLSLSVIWGEPDENQGINWTTTKAVLIICSVGPVLLRGSTSTSIWWNGSGRTNRYIKT